MMKVPKQEIYVGKNKDGYAFFNTREEGVISFEHLSWGIGFAKINPPIPTRRSITSYENRLSFSELEEKLRKEMAKGSETVVYNGVPKYIAGEEYNKLILPAMIYLKLKV